MVDPLVTRMAGSSIADKHGVKSMQKIIAVHATAKKEINITNGKITKRFLTSNVTIVCSSPGRRVDVRAVNKQNTWSPSRTAGLSM